MPTLPRRSPPVPPSLESRVPRNPIEGLPIVRIPTTPLTGVLTRCPTWTVLSTLHLPGPMPLLTQLNVPLTAIELQLAYPWKNVDTLASLPQMLQTAERLTKLFLPLQHLRALPGVMARVGSRLLVPAL